MSHFTSSLFHEAFSLDHVTLPLCLPLDHVTPALNHVTLTMDHVTPAPGHLTLMLDPQGL